MSAKLASRIRMLRRIHPRWQPFPDPFPGGAWVADVWRIRPATEDPLPLREQAHRARAAVLAMYAGVQPGALQIDHRPGGKPCLRAPFDEVEFNLTHCADLALLAVAHALPLGIDVEGERALRHPLRLARRVFDAHSLDQLMSVPVAGRNRRFIDLWTRLEARQKALGRGIFAEPVDPSMVHSLSFQPGRRHVACLSLTRPVADDEVRFFDFAQCSPPSP